MANMYTLGQNDKGIRVLNLDKFLSMCDLGV